VGHRILAQHNLRHGAATLALAAEVTHPAARAGPKF